MIRETALLQLIQAKGLGNSTLNLILTQIREMGYSLVDFVTASTFVMTNEFGLDSNIAHSIKNAQENADRLYEELQKKEIKIIIKGTPEYPSQILRILKETAPPILFVKGNTNLLNSKSIGFCGSRNVSEKGIQIAYECATELSQKGINIISGYARGVDLTTHKAALRSGGSTIFVIAEGILQFKEKKEVHEYLSIDNFLVISEFQPRLPWKAHNAMQRNRTICGLSRALILIESRKNGGTFEAGRTALELQQPLFVVEYAHPEISAEGNKYFLERGAIALRSNRQGKPKLDNVFYVLNNNISKRIENNVQMNFLDSICFE